MTRTADSSTAETLREAARLAAAHQRGWRDGVSGQVCSFSADVLTVDDVLEWGLYQCGWDEGRKLRDT